MTRIETNSEGLESRIRAEYEHAVEPHTPRIVLIREVMEGGQWVVRRTFSLSIRHGPAVAADILNVWRDNPPPKKRNPHRR